MNFVKKADRFFRDFILVLLDILKFPPLKLVDNLLFSPSSKAVQKEIFICKVDEIGDYLLFRNFLSSVRKSSKFKDYKILLCGNVTWKNLAENLDKDFVDEFIWLNKKKFTANLFYRFRFLKMIRSKNSEIAINSSYSRSFYINDAIIKAINASEKLGFKTDLSNSYKWQLNISDSYYSKLISADEEKFDFYKNKIFFEKILGEKISIVRPFIEKENLKSSLNIEEDYVVFFMGGRRNYKKWKPDNFLRIAEHLIKQHRLKIVLSGSSSETELNNAFFNKIKYRDAVKDLTGQTSLIDLLKILSEARLLLSNDSGIVHAAAALNIPVVVLANGTHYGRFLPYPGEIKTQLKVIYPPEISEQFKGENFPGKNIKYRSLYDINKISYETVKFGIDKLLIKPGPDSGNLQL